MIKSICYTISEILVDLVYPPEGGGIITDLIDAILDDYGGSGSLIGFVVSGLVMWAVDAFNVSTYLIPPEFNGLLLLVEGVVCLLPLVFI
jgi:hypothetical protein